MRKLILAAAVYSMHALPVAAATVSAKANIAAIKAVLELSCLSNETNDPDAAMAPLLNSPETKIFEFTPPRAHSWKEERALMVEYMKSPDSKLTCHYLEIHPTIINKKFAYSWAIVHINLHFGGGKLIDAVIRETDVWRKVRGRWYSVLNHNSVPVDGITGKADLQSAE
jgi:hypothetical protein